MEERLTGALSAEDRLRLLQLQELKHWTSRRARPEKDNDQEVTAPSEVPVAWRLVGDTPLYAWQLKAIDAWFAEGRRGMIKVVTGAGKTILALGIAEKLQAADPELRIAIVVPTIVLLDQWYDELVTKSNLPRTAIGRLGGGLDDDFDGERRILLCVLNSASRKLPALVARSGVGNHLLLIVDECHRAGASEMRRLFDVQRSYSIGLSATPERDDADGRQAVSNQDVQSELDDDEDEAREASTQSLSILEKQLGPVIFSLNYSDAVAMEILSTFVVEHYGLKLTTAEKNKYHSLSQEITDLRRQLETRTRRGLALIKWCRSGAGAADPRARRLIGLVGERKRHLYRIQQRPLALEDILRSAIKDNPRSRAIIFHESISEVMDLFVRLRNAGYAAVAEHSQLPDSLRSEAISLFRAGVANVIVSAKSLVEGFNVPSADIGIIVAASSSVRQRIQTLGRLLRKSESEPEKRARLIVLFASDTVDEMIYEKMDWDAFVGAERNEYYHWYDVVGSRPVRIERSPRSYVPSDVELPQSRLVPGERYPGKLDGEIFSVDASGSIFDADGYPVKLTPELAPKVREFMGGGRFLVTTSAHHMIKLSSRRSATSAIFLAKLSDKPRADRSQPVVDVDRIDIGGEYPLSMAHGLKYSVLTRDERLIARKSGGSVAFVRPVESLDDPEKRTRLRAVQAALHAAIRKGRTFSKIFVNERGHVLYLYEGRAYFAGMAPEGPRGFEME